MTHEPISAALERHADQQPDAPFIVTLSEQVTYGEAADAVAALRGELSRRGLRAGDRVLLMAPNGPHFVLAWMAVAGLDATIVPLHRQLPPQGCSRVERDCGASFLLGTAAAMTGHEDWSAIEPGHRVALDRLALDDQSPAPAVALALAEAANPCSILYTSGTTGPPKGAVLSHDAYHAAAGLLREGLGVEREDRILTALPLFHANPQFYAVATALAAGASVALLDRFSASTFLRDAAALEATGFTYVGTILAKLVLADEPVVEHRLRFCVGGGAPAPVWTEIERRWGVRVHELYGSTETGSFATLNTRSAYRHGSCGRARADMELAIVDEADRALAPGERGEVVVRPRRPSVLYDGYHGRPDLTVARSGNLWFHTGDLAWLDEDGYLYFAGRTDDRIRRGGENVDPRSVEEVVGGHPDLHEVAVVGVPDDVMGQEVKAVVVARSGFDPWSLPGFLEGRLPRLAWPRFVEPRTELPKTPTERSSSPSCASRSRRWSICAPLDPRRASHDRGAVGDGRPVPACSISASRCAGACRSRPTARRIGSSSSTATATWCARTAARWPARSSSPAVTSARTSTVSPTSPRTACCATRRPADAHVRFDGFSAHGIETFRPFVGLKASSSTWRASTAFARSPPARPSRPTTSRPHGGPPAWSWRPATRSSSAPAGRAPGTTTRTSPAPRAAPRGPT